jgi:UDP-N-acetylmuramate--alanine ligase
MKFGHMRHFHLVGIGGVGMTALAEVLLDAGFRVSGCDAAASERTRALAHRGASVWQGHDPAHLAGVDAVVVSAAIANDCPELIQARERAVPVVRRADMLAAIARQHRAVVAVAGTHGKTTCTAMLAHMLEHAGRRPTAVVGGRFGSAGRHGRLGNGELVICEADEYDRAFLAISADVVLLTNLEAEHLECYGSLEALERAFVDFAASVPFFGSVVVCHDDPGAARILPRLAPTATTYAINGSAQWQGTLAERTNRGSVLHVAREGRPVGEVVVNLFGHHNALNALGALAVADGLDIPFAEAAEAVASFRGVARRLEWIGRRRGVDVVDDYAHHPTELSAAIDGIRQQFPNRRLVAVFQPHLYSRTRDHATALGGSLAACDVAAVLPIYPAREAPIPGISSTLVVDAARQHPQPTPNVELVDDGLIADWLDDTLQAQDVLLTLGAGPVDAVGRSWLEREAP